MKSIKSLSEISVEIQTTKSSSNLFFLHFFIVQMKDDKKVWYFLTKTQTLRNKKIFELIRFILHFSSCLAESYLVWPNAFKAKKLITLFERCVVRLAMCNISKDNYLELLHCQGRINRITIL